MAEPEVVSTGNRAVTPGEKIGKTLSAPQQLMLIHRLLPAIKRRRIIRMGDNMYLLSAVELYNQRQMTSAGDKRREALFLLF